MFKKSLLASAIGVGIINSSLVMAAENGNVDTQLDAFVVTGITELEGLTSVRAEELKETQPTNMDEMFKRTPGVEGLNGPGRQFGDITIRGIDGAGSTVVSVDGAEKNMIKTSHGIASNPVFLVPEFLESIDIVKGPVANTFGTGSVGGRVNLKTVSPESLIKEGATQGGRLKLSAESNGSGRSGALIHAGKLSDSVTGLVGIASRGFDNYEDGSGTEIVNSESNVKAALVKLNFDPTDELSIDTVYQTSKHEYEGSDVFGRANYRTGTDSKTGEVTGQYNDNEVKDDSFSAEIRFAPQSMSNVDFGADFFYSGTTFDEIVASAGTSTRAVVGSKTNRETISRGVNLFTNIGFAGAIENCQHNLSIGVSNKKTESENENASTIAGDITTQGWFIHDRIALGSDWEVVPGLRYESWEAENESGSDSDIATWLPKLTVGYSPFENSDVKFYASVAKGMRAPSMDDLLLNETVTSSRTRGGSTTNTTSTTYSNSDLKAETATNKEVGFRFDESGIFTKSDRLAFDLAVYQNDFEDKIDEVVLSYSETTTGRTTNIVEEVQMQNVGKAEYKGVELSIAYDAGAYFGGLSYEVTEGKNKDTNEDINSVRPANGLVYGGGRFLNDTLKVGAEVEAWRSKTEVGENDGVVGNSTKAASIANLFGSYEINEMVIIDARVNNLFDREYRKFDTIDNGMGRNIKLAVTMNY